MDSTMRQSLATRFPTPPKSGILQSMRTSRVSKAAKSHHRATSSSQPELKVTLVYEDIEMGLQGKRIFDLIAREAGGQSAARLSMWRFDFLGSPDLTSLVNRETEEADVIIIAPRDSTTLPAPVQSWLEHWPIRRQPGQGALIALFAPTSRPPGQSSDAALLLWRAAGRAGMEFLYRCGTPTTPPATAKTAAPRSWQDGTLDLFAAQHPVCAPHPPTVDWDE